mgnify:FL=1
MENTGTLVVSLPGIDRQFRLDEWVHGRIFSTVRYGANQSATVNAYSYIQGQTVPDGGSSATERDTNMPEPARLPVGWEALIFSHQIEPAVAITLADIQDVQTKALYTLKVGRNVVYEAPLSRLPAGGGVSLVTTANATSQVNNGNPEPGARASFLIPVNLREMKTFSTQSIFPSALSLAAVRLFTHYLEGLIKRPIDTV